MQRLAQVPELAVRAGFDESGLPVAGAFVVLFVLFVIGLLIMSLIGIPIAWVVAIAVGIWVLYRIVRGWLALGERKPIAVTR